jgi:hypothetical protein
MEMRRWWISSRSVAGVRGIDQTPQKNAFSIAK